MSVERMQAAVINMIMRTDARTLKVIFNFVGAITMRKPEVMNEFDKEFLKSFEKLTPIQQKAVLFSMELSAAASESQTDNLGVLSNESPA